MIHTKHQLTSFVKDDVDYLKYLKSLDTSPVYETYWKFACERQDIYFNRLSKKDLPWTEDPVLKIHKFTNAYRAADRVSQYLIKNVIYRDDLPNSAEEIFFRIMLFKLFNKIETWQLLEKKLGAITYKNYSFKTYDDIFQKAMESKTRIYSAAYIMPSGSSSFGFSKKHQNHLQLLEMMMNDNLVGKLARITKMQQAFELMRSYPTLGDFLAYQFITDINYSELTDFSEMEFVIPGPGAKDGLKKCFKSNNVNEQELIRFMANHQEQEFNRLGLHFQSLWGRPLQLIDCQNLFCEVDKYSRIVHPEIVGISGRTRIKQKYSCIRDLELPWFPPKWNINEKIHQTSIMVRSN
ncbi:putative DNA base hypermodification protein [Acinetobacter baumannii]|nr:putative DNA base hypermodification protein [Acinetobacter baumannii]MDC5101209.1 putative DNA base hypermodification protein [Acinetobacter baumannii]MDC5310227.1 putative DNA base hypermodification protein [Acinetobacter baumannii]MDC5452980.1 putative DNA base hypermodification protein [Acinetobacter baumannii]MDC5610580.1 putative DNA base hypermodification protein [Acinetobacter baumannii]